MNAILLAAGFGSRLLPLTETTPKCLVKIGNKFLIDLWIEKLFDLGIKKILINTHYLKNVVEDHICKLGAYKEGRIVLSYEKELLGTAGTLINNIDFFDDQDGILLHADNYTRDNLKQFLKFHLNQSNDSYITMMTFRTNNPEKSGIVEIDENNVVKNFYEKRKGIKGNLANSAIYIISSDILNSFRSIKARDFSTEIIPKYLNKIKVYETNNYFIDIGDLKSLKKANKFNSLYEKQKEK
tara:strand:- start:908 stop:1627 length:720 start_codon:yes stop_codon:yes gene_type:complete